MSADTNDIDWRAFAASVLRPDSPRIDDATAAARGIAAESRSALRRLRMGRDPYASDLANALTDPALLARAWETITGRAGADQLFDDSARGGTSVRKFLPYLPLEPAYSDADQRAARSVRPRLLQHTPYDLETMAAVSGADYASIRTAEEAALEACDRMRPWGAPEVREVSWMLVPEHWPRSSAASWMPIFYAIMVVAAEWEPYGKNRTSYQAITKAMGLPDGSRADADSFWQRPRAHALQVARATASAWETWRRAVRAKARVTSAPDAMPDDAAPALVGTPFAELPNPFEPLLRVMGLGFMFLDVKGPVALLGLSVQEDEGITASSLSALRKEAQRRFGYAL